MSITSINTLNTDGYPLFEANQVLKHTDLSGLRQYLDGHNRITRTALIGMGIVCGLEMSIKVEGELSPAIEISAGCGLTSEGYVIATDRTILTHYEADKSVPVQLFQASQSSQSNQSNSSPVADESAATYQALELFAGAGDDRVPLSQTPSGESRNIAAVLAALQNQVLVVVCEVLDIRRDSCLVDCDDRGQDRSFRLRFFLLPHNQDVDASSDALRAEDLLHQSYNLDQLENPWASFPTEAVFTARREFLQETNLRLRRFGYRRLSSSRDMDTGPIVRLSDIKTYEEFLQNYYEICRQGITNIAEVLPEIFRLFSPLFTTFNPASNPTYQESFSNLTNRLTNRLEAIWSPGADGSDNLGPIESHYAIQYFYDYLSQIVAAYEELVEAACDLMDDCVPDIGRFPKFLLLGLLPNPDLDLAQTLNLATSPYRNHFVQPPIYNGNALRLQRIRHLYERLVRLCQKDSFRLSPFYPVPLQMTPSVNRSNPLSCQAIPYHLHYPNLYEYWNYDAYRKGLSNRHPAYFYPRSGELGTPITATDNLLHRLDNHDFYRIEGHIGQDKNEAVQELKAYQRQYNLPFDVIALKLGQSTEEPDVVDVSITELFGDLTSDIFHEFANSHPGLEYLGGVPQGGTFVLVYVQADDGTEIVVADFCLPYRSAIDLRLSKILDAVGEAILSPSFIQSHMQFWPPLAQAGVEVTLSGRNFNATPPRVFFGDVEANVLRTTDMEIVATAPESPFNLADNNINTTVNIRVVNEFGSAISDELFTFPREGFLPPFNLRFTALDAQGRPTSPFDASQGLPGAEFRVTLVRTANVIFRTEQVEGLLFWFDRTVVPVSEVRSRTEVGGGFTFTYMDAYLQIPAILPGQVSISVQTVFGIAVDVDTFTILASSSSGRRSSGAPGVDLL